MEMQIAINYIGELNDRLRDLETLYWKTRDSSNLDEYFKIEILENIQEEMNDTKSRIEQIREEEL